MIFYTRNKLFSQFKKFFLLPKSHPKILQFAMYLMALAS